MHGVSISKRANIILSIDEYFSLLDFAANLDNIFDLLAGQDKNLCKIGKILGDIGTGTDDTAF